MKPSRWILGLGALALAGCSTTQPAARLGPVAAPAPAPTKAPLPVFNLPAKPVWWIQYHNTPDPDSDGLIPGSPSPLRLMPEGGMQETFPLCSLNQRINYLTFQTYSRNLSAYTSISMDIGVTALKGAPKFVFWSPHNNCVGPACDPVSAKLMLWGPDKDVTLTTNRWFAFKQPFVLVPGARATVTVPMDGSQFEGVLGQNPTAGGKALFLATKKTSWAVAIVFGGGYYQGHGTCVQDGSGSATLQIYKVWLE